MRLIIEKRDVGYLFLFFFVLAAIATSAARFPVPRSDADNWGSILNQFLNMTLDQNGTVRNITFGVNNETIDNINDGWVRITSRLNVTNATAIGENSVAAGTGSLAVGSSAVARGLGSLAVGINTEASGRGSVAFGENSTASGANATAVGGATASGDFSFAGGFGVASGLGAFAFGSLAKAKGDLSTAFGDGSAEGGFAFAIGESANASGAASFAIGRATGAAGAYSFSGGTSTNASGENSFSIGQSTRASGSQSFATGSNTRASGSNAFAGGSGSTAENTQSVAFGLNSNSSGAHAFAVGDTAKANGTSSMALGSNTIASAVATFASGISSQAYGEVSTAMGNATIASGHNSFSVGYLSVAGGIAAIALGDQNYAQGRFSVALGKNNTAEGFRSTAMGGNISVSGTNSFGIGMSNSSFTLIQDDTFAVVGGYVGINTTTPNRNRALDVAGAVEIDLPGVGNTVALCHTDNTSTNQEIVDCAGAPSADYAEMYAAERNIEAGEIVVPGTKIVITKAGDHLVQLVKSNRPYQSTILGIISDPATATDFNVIGYNIKDEDNPLPVALNGRVKVKASLENGPIQIGDYLTSSSISGVAMKATQPGTIIGVALEPLSSSSSPFEKIMTFVKPGYYVPSDISFGIKRTLDMDSLAINALTQKNKEFEVRIRILEEKLSQK